MASPVRNGVPFQKNSSFFEFRPDNTLVKVTDSPNAEAFTAYQGRMLLLPTGEVCKLKPSRHILWSAAATRSCLLFVSSVIDHPL